MARWPKTYEYLADSRNAAADEALVAAARQLEGAHLRYAVEVLLHRAQPVGLLALVENYHRLPDNLKGLVLARRDDLAPVLRTAVRDIELQTRLNCLEAAGRIGDESLAYLFDLGLMDSHVRVREMAAVNLRRMARALLDDLPLLRAGGSGNAGHPAGWPASDVNERLAARREHLLDALISATQRYDRHLRPEIFEACLWYEPYLGARFWDVVLRKRSRLPHLMSELITTSDEPSTACLLVEAMAVDELRPAALTTISQRRDARWFEGVLRGVEIWHPWTKVRKALAHIKQINYLSVVDDQDWSKLARSPALPILLAAGNLPSRRRQDVLCCLWRVATTDCRRQILLDAWNNMDLAPTLLHPALCGSSDPQEARMAGYQLRRMGYEGLAGDLARRIGTPGDPAARYLAPLAGEEIFHRLWTQFDIMQEDRRQAALAAIRGFADRLAVRLRVHMASASSSCRIRAVRMAGMLGLVDRLWADVLAVAGDPNSRVRATAVRLLARSNQPQMRTALLAALDDVDGRVQANAIEAIDETTWPDKIDWILPKLHSEHNRVRANAARTLARAGDDRAVRILTTMLHEPRDEHRMTAVWTIRGIGPGRWMDALLELAEHDPSPTVRRCAQAAIRHANRVAAEPATDDQPPAVSADDQPFSTSSTPEDESPESFSPQTFPTAGPRKASSTPATPAGTKE